jgi:alpha-L-fucosidase
MATYLPGSGDGCAFPGTGVPPPSLFSPSQINTDQWVAAFQAFGAKYAVLVAKHGCGFTLWPSKVNFPKFNFTYNYTVAQSKSPVQDIVGSFVNSCRSHDIQPGFYYSVVTNYYLNVDRGNVQNSSLKPGMANVTQEQYLGIVMAQLDELWGQYGQLGEIWFDGGYQKEIKANLTAALMKLQPHATLFNGQGLSNNAIRWIGTEAGKAPDPNWSTGESGAGDPNSPIWCPAECIYYI